MFVFGFELQNYTISLKLQNICPKFFVLKKFAIYF